jgi:hypothetical protein
MSDDRVLLLEPEDALVQDDAPAPRLRFEWHADEHGELLPYIEGDHIDRLEQLQEELNRLREKRRRAARMVTIMPRERMGKVQKYIGRIVVVLTPLFVGLVAYGATQVEKLPGHPQLNQTEIVALMVLGAGAVLPGVVTWLVNLGKHERQVLADKHDRAREDAWRAAQPEIGEFGELLGKSIEDAVPLLREHLGAEREDPGGGDGAARARLDLGDGGPDQQRGRRARGAGRHDRVGAVAHGVHADSGGPRRKRRLGGENRR